MNDPNISPGADRAQEETHGGTTTVGGLNNTFDLASTGLRGTTGARCPKNGIKN